MGFASQGCTVTTTDGSVDGGGLVQSDGSTNTDSSTQTDGGGGDSNTTGGTCSGSIDVGGGQACQACANTKCCAQQQGCTADSADPAKSCKGYAECVADCYKNPPAGSDGDKCVEQVCDATVSEAGGKLYDAVFTCAATNCSAECGIEPLGDAGAQDAASE
jgi:hypothetical protein